MTKLELITKLEQYDIQTLTKLVTLADSLLSPNDTDLTSVDFTGMVSQVFDAGGLADQYFPTWTDKSKGDFGRFLVELFAVFSDKDFFYLNHLSKESFVRTAELYTSLVDKALEYGFVIPENTSASGIIEVTFSEGVEEQLDRGDIVIGSSSIEPLVYVNEAITIPQSSTDIPVNVPFLHGELNQLSGLYNGHSIVIRDDDIVPSSIELVINNEEWLRVYSFLDSDSTSKVYTVLSNESGQAEIFFGNNGYGLRPSIEQNFVVNYITGGGYIGDISSGMLDVVKEYDGIRELLTFRQLPMSSGNKQPSLENLRQIILGKNRSQERVVTKEDLVSTALELEFITKVDVGILGNYLYLYPLTTTAEPVSPSQITLIEDYINPKLLMGYFLKVSSPIFTAITLEVTVFMLPSYSSSAAQTLAEQSLEEYLNPLLLGTFSQQLRLANIINVLLQKVVGSQNVVVGDLYITGNPKPVADLLLAEGQLIDYANSNIKVNINGGF